MMGCLTNSPTKIHSRQNHSSSSEKLAYKMNFPEETAYSCGGNREYVQASYNTNVLYLRNEFTSKKLGDTR